MVINGLEKSLNGVNSVTTAKGSLYKYLPDGTTQRYKTVENKQYDPQDILVFVPNFEWVRENSPVELRESFGENEIQYDQLLLSYVQTHGKKCFVVDETGKKLSSNKEVLNSQSVFLTFGDEKKVDFFLPVTGIPKIGFYTFDTRKYEENGEYFRERHMGNKVISID